MSNNPALYNHFLILHAVIYILGTEELFRGDGVIDWCKGLLKKKLSVMRKIAMKSNLSLSTFIIWFKSLMMSFFALFTTSRVTALSIICSLFKILVISHWNMLEQAIKRVGEFHRNAISRSNRDKDDGQFLDNFSFHDLHSNGPLLIPILGSQYEKVKFGHWTLRTLYFSSQ